MARAAVSASWPPIRHLVPTAHACAGGVEAGKRENVSASECMLEYRIGRRRVFIDGQYTSRTIYQFELKRTDRKQQGGGST
jgi:hypothetical protein